MPEALLSQGAWKLRNRVGRLYHAHQTRELTRVTNIPPDSCLHFGASVAEGNRDNRRLCRVGQACGGNRSGISRTGLLQLAPRVRWKLGGGWSRLRHCHRCLQPPRPAFPGWSAAPRLEEALGGKCRSSFSLLQPTEQTAQQPRLLQELKPESVPQL